MIVIPKDKQKHYDVICEFIRYINSKYQNDFVLKGGTSLMLCYGLDRFSEDIDLDGFTKNIIPIVTEFCKQKGYTCNVNKDTPTVKRVMIHYDNEHLLKVEVSYRNRERQPDRYKVINDINVYDIEALLSMKLNAYANRDKIRDLYDVTFIYNHYANILNQDILYLLSDTLAYKGLEQFDYLIATQSDELINNDKLSDDFLTMWTTLGLLDDKTRE